MRILGGTIFVAVGLAFGAAARPVPRPAMAERLAKSVGTDPVGVDFSHKGQEEQEMG